MTTLIRVASVVTMISLVTWLAASGDSQNPVLNGSFETVGPLGDIGLPQDWEGLAMGTFPAAVRDCSVAHDGRCSLKIVTDKYVLAHVMQILDLDANRHYALTGWVKTKDLEVTDEADMFGTLVVVPSDPSREELAVKGPCHAGNTDWTQLRLEFQTTDDGRAYILCCLCGQGIGKGAVWFDDLRIVPIERLTATQTAPAASQPASRPADSRPAPAASQP